MITWPLNDISTLRNYGNNIIGVYHGVKLGRETGKNPDSIIHTSNNLERPTFTWSFKGLQVRLMF